MTREPPVMDSGRARVDETPEYLDCLSLRVEATAGSQINRCCGQLVKLAQRLGVLVETEFNGVIIYARPTDDPDDLVRKWWRTLDARSDA